MDTLLFLVSLTAVLVTSGIQPIFKQNLQLVGSFTPTQSSETQFDFSGEWIDTNGRKWNIHQNDAEIGCVEVEGKMAFVGTLEGRVIKHTTYAVIAKTKDKRCKEYIDKPIYFEARLILSEDGNSMEYKYPDTVNIGKCVLDYRNAPAFSFTRVKAI